MHDEDKMKNPILMDMRERIKDSEQRRAIVSGFFEALHILTGTPWPEGGVDLTDKHSAFALQHAVLAEKVADGYVEERQDPKTRMNGYRAIVNAASDPEGTKQFEDGDDLYTAERIYVALAVSGPNEVKVEKGVVTLEEEIKSNLLGCNARPLQLLAAAAYALLGEQPVGDDG